MIKKIVSIMVSINFVFFILLTNVKAADIDYDMTKHNSCTLCLSDENTFFDEQVDTMDINEFNRSSSPESLLCYDVILANPSVLDIVDTDKVIELIDNGTALLVEGSYLSMKEVANKLNLPETEDRYIEGAQVTGIILLNHNDNYCFGLYGVMEGKPIVDDIQTDVKVDITKQEPVPIYYNKDKYDVSTMKDMGYKANVNDFITSIQLFKNNFNKEACKSLNGDVVYMQLPSNQFDGEPYYGHVDVIQEKSILLGPEKKLGAIDITQYRYDVCSYNKGKYLNKIFDIVANFTISATERSFVNNYKATMTADSLNHSIIGQSYLYSNSSSSYTLSGGLSYDGAVISGEIDGSTTNTYDTNNQTIINEFSKAGYKSWSSEPTKKWPGQAWQLEPCIRVENCNAGYRKSQVYSSIDEYIIVYCSGGELFPYMIDGLKVGGAW